MKRDILKIYHDEAGIGMSDYPIREGIIERPTDKNILEIGYGKGDLVANLCRDNLVCGIDAGEESMRQTYARGLHKRANLLWGDACRLQYPWFDDYFDYAFCMECFEHLSDPLHTFLEIKRVLRDGGLFIVTHPEHGDKFGFVGGKHAFVYPGIGDRENFRWFLTQCFFSIETFETNGGTDLYVLINRKVHPNEEELLHPFEQVRGNIDIDEYFGWLGNKDYLDTWDYVEDGRRISDGTL